MKKLIKCILCFFICISLFELFATQADFDFFVEFLPLRIFGSIIIGSILYFKSDSSTSSYNRHDYSNSNSDSYPEQKMELIKKDYDIKEIKLNIKDYRSNWFNYDIFLRDFYDVSIIFHSENFKNTGLPADFSASKSHYETFMNGGFSNWFYIELDHHGVGHGHDAAENQELEDFLIDCSHKSSGIRGIYDCTFKIKDYQTLMEVCSKISSFSDKTEISKYVGLDKEHVEDFIAKLVNIAKIPQELKDYFAEDFIKDISEIKCKRDEITSSKRICYKSAIVIKNYGEPIFYVELEPNSLNMKILDESYNKN